MDDTWILRAAKRRPDSPRFRRWSSGGGHESSPRYSALKSRQIRRSFRYVCSAKIPEESRCLRIGIAALADKGGDHHLSFVRFRHRRTAPLSGFGFGHPSCGVGRTGLTRKLLRPSVASIRVCLTRRSRMPTQNPRSRTLPPQAVEEPYHPAPTPGQPAPSIASVDVRSRLVFPRYASSTHHNHVISNTHVDASRLTVLCYA